jgi:hypothetical protein
MSSGKRPVRVLVGLGLSCLVLGCFGLPDAPLPAPQVPPRAGKGPAAPEMRIPSAAAAAAPDEIPLVPLPLPGDRPPPVKQAAQAAQPPEPKKAEPVEAVKAPQPAQADGPEAIRQLYRRAAERVAAMDSYITRLTRREQVNGEDRPEEVLLFRFRREPWSVYFKWIGPIKEGREVTYVKGRYNNEIHSLLAAGDHPFKAAGCRHSIAPDSVFVLANARHPITEAGLAASVQRLGAVLAAQERNDDSRGTLVYLGAQQRVEFAQPVPCVEHVLPPGLEKALPKGGRRLYAFDPASGLPTLIQTRDDRGHEVEYYFYDRLLWPVGLLDDDFDPDRLWPKRVAGKDK